MNQMNMSQDLISTLTLAFAGVSAVAATLAPIIAIPQLFEMSRSGRMESTLAFIEKLKESSDDRRIVYSQLPDNQDEMENISPELRKKTLNIVNALNELGTLLEENMIDKRIFFGMCHTIIIRGWYKLELFVRHEESKIGGRYGRRIERLDKRAKLYHDINKKHRITVIKIPIGTETRVIYETKIEVGLKRIQQKIKWFFIRNLKMY